MEELKYKLKEQIIKSLNLQGITPESIDDDAPIFGDGLGLDSIDALELMVMLERNYGIKVGDSKQGRKILESVNTLAEYVAKHQSEQTV